MLYEFGRLRAEGRLRAGLGARRKRRLCARLARRFSGHRGTRPCRNARRQAAGAAHGRALRPLQRKPGGVTAALERLWDKLKDTCQAGPCRGAFGRHRRRSPQPPRSAPFWRPIRDLAVRATGTYLGHGVEPQFVMNVALAAIALGHGSLFPPCDSTGLERPMARRFAAGCGDRGRALAGRRPRSGRAGRLKESDDGIDRRTNRAGRSWW